MKRMLIILLVAFWIFGCVGSGTKDCGTDMTCFEQAAKTCSPAKVTSSQSGAEMQLTLNGIEGSNCVFSMKIAKSPEMQILEGKEMTCKVPKEVVTGDISMNSLDANACTGSLIDLMKSLGAVTQQ